MAKKSPKSNDIAYLRKPSLFMSPPGLTRGSIKDENELEQNTRSPGQARGRQNL